MRSPATPVPHWGRPRSRPRTTRRPPPPPGRTGNGFRKPAALAKLHPPGEVDRALGTAAVAGRFAENGVLRILAHQAGRDINKPILRASETHSLQPGTAAWSGFGVTAAAAPAIPPEPESDQAGEPA